MPPSLSSLSMAYPKYPIILHQPCAQSKLYTSRTKLNTIHKLQPIPPDIPSG